MNTSLQAAGRLSPDYANPVFPWRCVVLLCGTEWVRYCVFETRTEAEAHEVGNEMAIDIAIAPGVTGSHYYVGEVAL